MQRWNGLAILGVTVLACSAIAQDIKPAATQPTVTPQAAALVKGAVKGVIAFKDLAALPKEAQVKTDSGLIIEELTIGTGASPTANSTVVCHYTGWLTDGTKFDSSRDRNDPLTFQLGQVIKGWQEGLKTMKVGGRRKLTIPANLGYGAQGAGESIPPNATLVFDVELIDVK